MAIWEQLWDNKISDRAAGSIGPITVSGEINRGTSVPSGSNDAVGKVSVGTSRFVTAAWTVLMPDTVTVVVAKEVTVATLVIVEFTVIVETVPMMVVYTTVADGV